MLNIALDTAALDGVLQGLRKPRLDDAVAKALADTQRNGKTRAASLIARHMGVRSGTVKERIQTPFVVPGTGVAQITASRRPIALIDFPTTRQTGGGITTRAWGRPVTIRSGFIATMPSGHTGAYRRVGPARLPIKQLWGPTIWGTFVTPDVAEPMRQRLAQQLPTNLARRVRSEMRRRG